MQFTGYHPRRIRGEQIAKQLLDGESFGRGGALGPTATPAAHTTPDASALPASAGRPITTWRPPRSAPLSDAQAAARVRPVGEVLPQNRVANGYRPSGAEIRAFLTGQRDAHGRLPAEYNPALGAVTGNFAGTTDEILQWAAHKWGIPEDLARAVAVTESSWRQDAHGDRRTVSDPLLYPAQSLILGTSDVFESLGLMQIKWRPDGSVGNGTEPLRWKSTAFNADYWGAVVRYYYDGLCYWCSPDYTSGQEWPSIGAWYNPSPWVSASTTYVDNVQGRLAQRRWAQPGF